MKINLTILVIFISANFSFGQTPSSVMSNGGKFKQEAEGASGFNPWLGAQLVHNFEGTGDFTDNLVITGRLLYELNTSSQKFKIPVMGNISDLKSELLTDKEKLDNALSEIVIGDQGLNIGIYPYYVVDDYADDDFYFIIHGSAGWKLNGFQVDTTTTNYLNTGRFSAGIEIGYGLLNEATGDKPITLSLTPVYSIFDKAQYNEVFGEEKGSLFSFEITGIIPISKTGIGIMLQSVISPDTDNTFRAGIILTGKSNE